MIIFAELLGVTGLNDFTTFSYCCSCRHCWKL